MKLRSSGQNHPLLLEYISLLSPVSVPLLLVKLAYIVISTTSMHPASSLIIIFLEFQHSFYNHLWYFFSILLDPFPEFLNQLIRKQMVTVVVLLRCIRSMQIAKAATVHIKLPLDECHKVFVTSCLFLMCMETNSLENRIFPLNWRCHKVDRQTMSLFCW